MIPQTGFYTPAGLQSQSFDFYPADTSAASLMIYVHGGAWRFGDKSSLLSSEHGTHQVRRFFSRAGFACASINYRLSDEALFPAQINDVKTAIRYFRTRAEKFGINPAHIVLVGGSAGGHLTMLAAATGGLTDPYYEGLSTTQLESEVSSEVAAAVSFYGVSDLRTIYDDRRLCGLPYHHPDDDGAEWRLLGSGYPAPAGSSAEINWKLAHPLDLMVQATAVGKRRCAPLYLIHGSSDSCVPPLQSIRVYEELKKRGITTHLELIEDGDHSDPRCYTDPVLEQMVNWTKEQLG